MKALAVFLALGFVCLCSGAQAQQYRWHVVHQSYDAKHQYMFTSVDCAGEVCIASGATEDPSIHDVGRVHRMFFRSTDGGVTWVEQDPGLPPQKTLFQAQIMKVQQIDSLNAVGVGDSGLIVRTFDGGQTWEQQDLHTDQNIGSIHFADPMTGIAVVPRPTGGVVDACDIETTTDGGRRWTKAPFSPWLFSQDCHADGGANFRVISYQQGPIYSTHDNWHTVDSTALIVPLADNEHIIGSFVFKGKDTIVGIGSTSNKWLYIPYSTDGGVTWDSATVPKSSILHASTISPLSTNVVFLAVQPNTRNIGVSTDYGLTWRLDTMALDTDVVPYLMTSIAITGKNEPIAVVAGGPGAKTHGFLARGTPEQSSVETYERIIYSTSIYPNPATSTVTITSIDQRRPIIIRDVLGREVARSMLSESGTAVLNTSAFADGVYTVTLDHFGNLLPVGKLVIAAK